MIVTKESGKRISMRGMESIFGPTRACTRGSGRMGCDMGMVLFQIKKGKSTKSNGKREKKSSFRKKKNERKTIHLQLLIFYLGFWGFGEIGRA